MDMIFISINIKVCTSENDRVRVFKTKQNEIEESRDT